MGNPRVYAQGRRRGMRRGGQGGGGQGQHEAAGMVIWANLGPSRPISSISGHLRAHLENPGEQLWKDWADVPLQQLRELGEEAVAARGVRGVRGAERRG